MGKMIEHMGDIPWGEMKHEESTEGRFGKWIEPVFFKDLPAKKENLNPERSSAIQNKIDGCRREKEVERELKEKYPERDGYQVLRERVLCDENGNPVIDKETGEKRRIDFVVVKDGKVVAMVEVTSKTAPKLDQMKKEYRIRDNGGNYVKDTNGNICRIPNNVETKVERRD